MVGHATIPVKLTPEMHAFLSRRAAVMGRTFDEALDDALQPALEQERNEAWRKFGEAFEQLQREAARNGISGMTMDEINEEIELARQQARPAEVLTRSA